MKAITKYRNEAELPDLGKCPSCGTPLVRIWGEGWTLDLAKCPSKDCGYSMEQLTITGHDADGSIFVYYPYPDVEDRPAL